ncbi:hypothetical protein OG618_37270 (plasmid) [Kitasatospora sp. NBC_01246]|uniref:hypothetical protein n=1 Tax=Kitasatospora sp. NBC_01246 TaxID=2903570 RepID=UPI002E2F0968|nr:hypothetical protein [Kitasatospora sp. NBC_01246]
MTDTPDTPNALLIPVTGDPRPVHVLQRVPHFAVTLAELIGDNRFTALYLTRRRSLWFVTAAREADQPNRRAVELMRRHLPHASLLPVLGPAVLLGAAGPGGDVPAGLSADQIAAGLAALRSPGTGGIPVR